MGLIRLWKAAKQLKKIEDQAKVNRALSDNPLTVELIAQIAKEYQYHFEIVQKDGVILRFWKEGVPRFDDPSDREFF